jgi:hypothetical protein
VTFTLDLSTLKAAVNPKEAGEKPQIHGKGPAEDNTAGKTSKDAKTGGKVAWPAKGRGAKAEEDKEEENGEEMKPEVKFKPEANAKAVEGAGKKGNPDVGRKSHGGGGRRHQANPAVGRCGWDRSKNVENADKGKEKHKETMTPLQYKITDKIWSFSPG